MAALNPVIAAGEIGVETDSVPPRIKIGDGTTAWSSLAYIDSSATNLTAGTLPDARLSSSVVTASSIAARFNQTTAVIEPLDRSVTNTAIPPVSGGNYWTFFTPAYSVTVTQISMANTTVSSGVTLARMGIYTADASGNATLVARTASDTTLFTSTANTVFTRSLNTTGGYPASYTLTAGTRYAVGLCLVASGLGNIVATSIQSHVAALSPRIQGVRTGNSDLVTGQGSGQYNGSVGHAYWARLS